jgi:NodT family efflux transporter outer membrane factor (OMF) lipoprotein
MSAAVRMLAAAGSLTLLGCAVGPNFRTPEPPTASGYVAGQQPAQTEPADERSRDAQRFLGGEDVPGRWWTLFRSPALDALVDQCLAANPNLAAAQDTLRAANQTYLAQRGAMLPTVGLDFTSSRQRASATLAPPLSSSDDLYSLHTAQLTIAYVPDVFGGLRRQTEAAQANAEAQRFQTEATYLTLTSSLVVEVIQAAATRDQLEALRTVVKADSDALAIMRAQQSSGQISGSDVAAQEALLAQAEAALPPLEKQLSQSVDLIADLTGHPPSDRFSIPQRLADLTLPSDIPLSLPAQLVRQRPDIRAAEANLHAASAEVGVAIANRLPNLTLSANAGGTATDIGRLFADSNGFWMVAGDIAQPIFQGGALRARQRAAEAQLDQAKHQYQGTVLAALQNVADSLQALNADARAQRAASAAEQAASRSLALARRRLDLGQDDALGVLNAEQAYQQAVIGKSQAEANRLEDTAALFQALGGGWWNRAETSAQ